MKTDMNDIRIFMCCHDRYEIIPPLCEPIQCGTAINPGMAGILHDNEGENISRKNREYCELTAHFFAWKNISAKYYGFCHYRRFFCAGEQNRPYLVRGKLSETDRNKLFRDEEYWRGLINEYEMIVPKSEDMGITAGEHYRTSEYHYAEDLELFLKILYQKNSHFEGFSRQYLSQNRQYFCNMFVMDKKHFFEYCSILFDVLNEFDKIKKPHGDFQSDRTNGYLGEIFTGIYITYCREKGARIKELSRLDVNCTLKKRVLCALLPAQSKRRFLVKKFAKKLKEK